MYKNKVNFEGMPEVVELGDLEPGSLFFYANSNKKNVYMVASEYYPGYDDRSKRGIIALRSGSYKMEQCKKEVVVLTSSVTLTPRG